MGEGEIDQERGKAWNSIHTMTASGEANMETRDAMLTLPTNSCRTGWSNKAMLACAMSANAKTTSTRSPVILSCRGREWYGVSQTRRQDRKRQLVKIKVQDGESKAIELPTRVVLLSA